MRSEEILICEPCKGRGVLMTDVLVDYHKREYDTESRPCYYCKGSGRMRKITVTEWKPYE